MLLKNISLKKYNTFGFTYTAQNLLELSSEEEAKHIFGTPGSLTHPLFVLGGGSNILFTEDYKGTLIHSLIQGINVEEKQSDDVIISAGSGTDWDNLVEWTVNRGFGGLENLSFIPGNAGAAPVQNIGAYGVEVKDSIYKVRAISLETGEFVVFSNNDCGFGYRNSIFKNELKGKYLITKVYFRLKTQPVFNLQYGSLKEEIAKAGGESLKSVREAVINIRRSKLPDPETIGNAGSFFKNPVVNREVADQLKVKYPNMPFYLDQSDGVKLAAGWLIEQAGWKGKRVGDAGVHDKQALVIVNYGKATGKEIYDLSEAVKNSVSKQFGVTLEREVQVIGTT